MISQLNLKEEEIITKAWEDAYFKQALLSDPAKTLAEELGFNLPIGLKIRVLEETDDTMFLILPKKPDHGIDFENQNALDDLEMAIATYGECDSWTCGTGGHDC